MEPRAGHKPAARVVQDARAAPTSGQLALKLGFGEISGRERGGCGACSAHVTVAADQCSQSEAIWRSRSRPPPESRAALGATDRPARPKNLPMPAPWQAGIGVVVAAGATSPNQVASWRLHVRQAASSLTQSIHFRVAVSVSGEAVSRGAFQPRRMCIDLHNPVAEHCQPHESWREACRRDIGHIPTW